MCTSWLRKCPVLLTNSDVVNINFKGIYKCNVHASQVCVMFVGACHIIVSYKVRIEEWSVRVR